jgi:hypothetical protein
MYTKLPHARLDTHYIATHIFRAKSPMTNLKIGTFLTELDCPFGTSDLHSVANDMTYALNALLRLEVKSCESREIRVAQRGSLQRSGEVIQLELYQCRHWMRN